MTPKNRRRYADTMMGRAKQALATAEGVMTDYRDYFSATSRAYYAMFYAATALLGARDIFRSKHRGVVSAFGEQFAKTGDMDAELGTLLQQAFRARLGCDYDAEHEGTHEEAEATIESARRFIRAAEERLNVELKGLR